ncbi:MAG: ABC transporter permease [Gammaproteobacteria bacterium]|nr:MAG: ABC transporter permease [Gammaproteobacteria bacterium]RLA12348.1 MAG: ABC transporter permease [Gammaproteobacteria bacterium]
MTWIDRLSLAFGAITANRVRLMLILAATATGVAAVILLTSLGNGARHFVINQFSSLGTNLVIVLPGRSETTGGPPPMMGVTERDLTLDDALALKRTTGVDELAPIVVGSGPVSRGSMSRDTPIVGTTADLQQIRRLEVGQGKFITTPDPRRATSIAVLGYTLKQELFGDKSAVGEWIRVEDRRFRVVGVLVEQGNSFDLDWNEIVVVPVATAQQLFDTQSVFRILISRGEGIDVEAFKTRLHQAIAQRHDGDDDITVLSQDALLKTFNRIFSALTLALAGIAAISLIVAGVLIMNVMLVSVSQRTAEVGLLKALGAPSSQILKLFLTEAFLLSISGAIVGLGIGLGGAWIVRALYPAIPAHAPLWAIIGGVIIALISGLLFGWLPARRAAQLDPVLALMGSK